MSRERKTATILERDRLYAEHMYRKEKGAYGGAEREGKPNPHLDRKPVGFEKLLLWLMGD